MLTIIGLIYQLVKHLNKCHVGTIIIIIIITIKGNVREK